MQLLPISPYLDQNGAFQALANLHTKLQVGQGLILGTRWGASFRLRVSVLNADASVKSDLGVIAAQATVGLINASYELEGLGIADPTLFGILPGHGRFDARTYADIMAAMGTVRKEYFGADRSKLTPVPFMIMPSDPAAISAAFPDTSGTFDIGRYQQLLEGVTEAKKILAQSGTNLAPQTHLRPAQLSAATADPLAVGQSVAYAARDRSLSESVVALTYQTFWPQVVRGADPPETVRGAASAWLRC